MGVTPQSSSRRCKTGFRPGAARRAAGVPKGKEGTAMKICENCGARLDAGERCNCQGQAAILKEPETAEVTQLFKSLPEDEQRKLYYMMKGIELVADKAG